ncbi:MAG: hypothetical protein ACOCV1_04135 [Bacillota bacterium]
MKNLEEIELLSSLVLLDDPSLSDDEIIKRVLKEFGVEMTKEDLQTLYASYLPDNFENESRIMEYYGTFSYY